MTIERLYKTIDIMRQTYPFDKDDATIIVEPTKHGGDTVKIVTMDDKNNTGIILSKYVDWEEEL